MKDKKEFIVGMPKSEKVENFSRCDQADKHSTVDAPSKNTARGDVYPKK